ncbi:Inter-alpha-trypsin inhibitor heavy chain H4, partial [Gryllus bimaculatus]
ALVRWEAGEEAQRRLAAGDGLRGQLEIQYDVKQTDTSQLLMSEGGYFVHFFSLPESHLPMPKHLIFVLDVCQSMYGNKMQQMKEAMAAILSELSERDAFTLVTFSAETRVWVRGLGFVAATEGHRNTVVGATSDMVLEAREVVGQLQHQPTAGTQLLSAVLAAYRAVREGREWAMGGAPRQPLVLL